MDSFGPTEGAVLTLKRLKKNYRVLPVSLQRKSRGPGLARRADRELGLWEKLMKGDQRGLFSASLLHDYSQYSLEDQMPLPAEASCSSHIPRLARQKAGYVVQETD